MQFTLRLLATKCQLESHTSAFLGAWKVPSQRIPGRQEILPVEIGSSLHPHIDYRLDDRCIAKVPNRSHSLILVSDDGRTVLG